MGCDNWDLGLSGSQNPVTSALRLNLLSPLGDSWFKSLQNDSKIAPGMEIRLRVSIIGMSTLGWLYQLVLMASELEFGCSCLLLQKLLPWVWVCVQGDHKVRELGILFLCVCLQRDWGHVRQSLGNQWVWVRACGGPIWGICSEVGGACWCGCGVWQDKSWLHFQIISPICFQAK